MTGQQWSLPVPWEQLEGKTATEAQKIIDAARSELLGARGGLGLISDQGQSNLAGPAWRTSPDRR